MGLSVSVFVLASAVEHDQEHAAMLREQVERINAVLQKHGINEFTEPEVQPVGLEQTHTVSFPVGNAYQLHRAYARARRGLEVTPVVDEVSEKDANLIDEVSALLDSHLLCHSIVEGYYAPVDFDRPIFDDEVFEGALGSSHALLRELRFLAPALKIAVTEAGELTDAARAELSGTDEDHPLAIERMVWFALFESARISVEHGTLIEFG